MSDNAKRQPSKRQGSDKSKRRGHKRGGKSPTVMVKHRHDRHWIYGWHAVLAALENDTRTFHRVWATRNAADKLEAYHEAHNRARTAGLEIADPASFSTMLPPDSVHQGIAAEVAPLDDTGYEQIVTSSRRGPILVLDQITDPHNIGAILRSAAAFEAKGLVMTTRKSPQESGIIAKAAAGGLEIVPIARVPNLCTVLLAIKSRDFWVMGLCGDAEQPLHRVDLPDQLALVLGAEGTGLRRLTREHCDLLAKLPMSERMESLNVSNAAAIALYEMYKNV